ncbi:hypothetical protein AGMMS49944_19670 [Spirochaetia bacterium]|nr:hypothetical protein AGMMS49944_19670 [Spirochaetia bacterium]
MWKRRAEEPEHNKVMLVRHGDESTIKRVKKEDGKIFLCWEDGSDNCIEVGPGDYQVQGEFVSIMRGLE